MIFLKVKHCVVKAVRELFGTLKLDLDLGIFTSFFLVSLLHYTLLLLHESSLHFSCMK